MFKVLLEKLKKLTGRKPFNYENVNSQTLMAAIRHECHRTEKSFYNNILDAKKNVFEKKIVMASTNFDRLAPEDKKDPSMIWAKKIIDAFPEIGENFVLNNKQEIKSFSKDFSTSLMQLMHMRRSNRLWDDSQPSKDVLIRDGNRFIEAAITAPCSGNRQGVRFKLILDKDERLLLKGIKEYHCYSAPLLIFIAIESSVYYSLGDSDLNCKYLDAAAAAMQIINMASSLNYGTCWNHFDKYLVSSRKLNEERYEMFADQLNIPVSIEPVAIISIGRPLYGVPEPKRMDLERFIL